MEKTIPVSGEFQRRLRAVMANGFTYDQILEAGLNSLLEGGTLRSRGDARLAPYLKGYKALAEYLDFDGVDPERQAREFAKKTGLANKCRRVGKHLRFPLDMVDKAVREGRV